MGGGGGGVRSYHHISGVLSPVCNFPTLVYLVWEGVLYTCNIHCSDFAEIPLTIFPSMYGPYGSNISRILRDATPDLVMKAASATCFAGLLRMHFISRRRP